jgi:hypothetical protein
VATGFTQVGCGVVVLMILYCGDLRKNSFVRPCQDYLQSVDVVTNQSKDLLRGAIVEGLACLLLWEDHDCE